MSDGIYRDMTKPTIVLRDPDQPELPEGLRQRVAKLPDADLTDKMWKSLKSAIFVGYMLIDTFKLGEKGDMDDAICQARAKLRFGPAAVDGQSAARLGARTSGGGSAGKTGRRLR